MAYHLATRLPPSYFAAEFLLPLLTLQGPTRHIESIGRAGEARCGIGLVMTQNGGVPRIAEWSEFSVKGAGQP